MITPLIILTLLVSPLLIAYVSARFSGRELDRRRYACWGLGITFIFFAIGHAIKTAAMVEMLPPWVPQRVWIIYLTGVLEAYTAWRYLSPACRPRPARWPWRA